MCDEEVASRCAQAHTGTGVAVQSARRICAVRLQLAVGEFKAGMDDGEGLSEKTLRAVLEQGQGDRRVVGRGAVAERAKYAIIDFGQASAVWGAHRKCVKAGQQVPPVKSGPTIGVDVGVGKMAVCSDGTTVENPKARPPA